MVAVISVSPVERDSNPDMNSPIGVNTVDETDRCDTDSLRHLCMLPAATFVPQNSTSNQQSEAKKYEQRTLRSLQRSKNPLLPHQTRLLPQSTLFRNQTSYFAGLAASPPKRIQSKEQALIPADCSQIQRTNKNPPNERQFPTGQNVALFSCGYYGNGEIEDVREQVVKRYIFGRERKESVESSFSTESSELEQQRYDHRQQLSCLTTEAKVAPRAPGERRVSFETKSLFSAGSSEVEQEGYGHRQQLNCLTIEANVAPRAPGEGRVSFETTHLVNPILRTYRCDDLEAPSGPDPHGKQWNSMRETKRPRNLKSLAPITSKTDLGSDDGSSSSKRTNKSVLSAKWSLLLPSRRSSSAIHSADVKCEPIAEQYTGVVVPAKLYAIAACICTLMIIAAVLLPVFVPRGILSPRRSRPHMTPPLANDQTKTPKSHGDIMASHRHLTILEEGFHAFRSEVPKSFKIS